MPGLDEGGEEEGAADMPVNPDARRSPTTLCCATVCLMADRVILILPVACICSTWRLDWPLQRAALKTISEMTPKGQKAAHEQPPSAALAQAMGSREYAQPENNFEVKMVLVVGLLEGLQGL